jgi:hypothetical protein
MLRRVARVRTDVSEELSASFIRVTTIGELRTTLAVTSNRRTLRRNTKYQEFIWVYGRSAGSQGWHSHGCLWANCETLDVSQPSGPPRLVTSLPDNVSNFVVFYETVVLRWAWLWSLDTLKNNAE